MKKALVYNYAPFLILILASSPFVANLITYGSAAINSIANSSDCHTSFNYDSSFPLSVLVISSGSTAHICVEYSNTFNNAISGPSYISIYQYNPTGEYGVCPSCSFNLVTSLFQPTSSPDSIAFTRDSGSSNQRETVTYTLTVPISLTSGIFGISIAQFCSLFPMAVIADGEAHVALTTSAFSSWYPHEGSCPAQVMNRSLLGVDGFQVMSLWLGSAWTGATTSQEQSSHL